MAVPGDEARAIALFREGRLAEADPVFRAVLAADPGNAKALAALGLIAAQSERREEALDLLRRALAAGQRSYVVLYNLGRLLRQAGRAEEALAAFRDAAAADARGVEAQIGIATSLRDLGDRALARGAFEQALRIDPSSPIVHYNLALLEAEEGRLEAAEAALRKVLAREAANAAAWNNLGIVLTRRGAPAGEARECFERAAAADPRSVEALNNLGMALAKEDRLDAAISAYRNALAIAPGFAPALLNWGNALKDRGDLDGAIERYSQGLAVDPANVSALVNSGSVELARARHAEARCLYERALEIRPDLADAQYALGLIALFEHDFARGWDAYEARFDTDPPVASLAAPRLRRLSTEDLGTVKRVAVRSEQGLGDQILYSTLLTELSGRGIGGVVELDPRLLPAYRRSVAGFDFVALGESKEEIARCEREVALGSLPRFFRRTLESFERQPGHLLVPDARRVQATRERLGDSPRVGISWRTFQAAGRRYIGARKTIPLERFGALAHSGYRLLDLQYGDVSEERRRFDERFPGLRLEVPGLDPRNDLEGLLAAVEACDLVITASNVTAHFAGAIGKRTWLVYLGAKPPFPYWTPRADGRSPWYPSVEIVTDARWNDWETAFAAIAERLRRQ
jgi:tetratricopeptide (TPR) repeat protein